MTPLTDKEFAESGLAECWRGFAFWGEEGYLVTVAMHKGVLDKLKPE
jgi:hypothetical protein